MRLFNFRGSLLTLAVFIGCSLSLPADFDANVEAFNLASGQSGSPLTRRAISNGVHLRILPIGDSITEGYKSTDGNGYRLYLLNLLRGNPVDYIGSLRTGSMQDNEHEGHFGNTISQIRSAMQVSLPLRPNIALIMAGTNDINVAGQDPAGAPGRLEGLVDDVIKACPDAVVVLAQLVPFADNAKQAQANTFNAAVAAIVRSRARAGKKILLANMMAYVKLNDLADGLHPNDVGYSHMADAWRDAIVKAGSNGWIQEPVVV